MLVSRTRHIQEKMPIICCHFIFFIIINIPNYDKVASFCSVETFSTGRDDSVVREWHLTVVAVECPTKDTPIPVYLPHESQCWKFYECDHGHKVLLECPPGLYFDTTYDVCNTEVDCGDLETTTREPTTTTTEPETKTPES